MNSHSAFSKTTNDPASVLKLSTTFTTLGWSIFWRIDTSFWGNLDTFFIFFIANWLADLLARVDVAHQVHRRVETGIQLPQHLVFIHQLGHRAFIS